MFHEERKEMEQKIWLFPRQAPKARRVLQTTQKADEDIHGKGPNLPRAMGNMGHGLGRVAL
jgi:hypothetical protein